MKNTAQTYSVVSLQPELYRVKEAAAVLGVSPRMIHTLIETGALVPVRLPGSGSKRQPIRIARADLLAFVGRLRGETA